MGPIKPNVVGVQDMPPKGGYPPIALKRVMSGRGPSGLVIWVGAIAATLWGLNQVSILIHYWIESGSNSSCYYCMYRLAKVMRRIGSLTRKSENAEWLSYPISRYNYFTFSKWVCMYVSCIMYIYIYIHRRSTIRTSLLWWMPHLSKKQR